MAIRAGMRNLVELLSDKTSPGDEFTLLELQEALDRNFVYFKYFMLTPDITRTPEQTAIYVDYYIPRELGEYFEIPQTGEIAESFYLQTFTYEPVMWGTGDTQAQYNDVYKRITFNQNQQGKSYFLSGKSYDLNGAAAEIWLRKWANREKYVDLKTDNHQLALSQSRDFCYQQYQYYSSLSRKNIGTRFIRTDQVYLQSNPLNVSRKPY